jgi:hypothetical protein
MGRKKDNPWGGLMMFSQAFLLWVWLKREYQKGIALDFEIKSVIVTCDGCAVRVPRF